MFLDTFTFIMFVLRIGNSKSKQEREEGRYIHTHVCAHVYTRTGMCVCVKRDLVNFNSTCVVPGNGGLSNYV